MDTMRNDRDGKIDGQADVEVEIIVYTYKAVYVRFFSSTNVYICVYVYLCAYTDIFVRFSLLSAYA